MVARNALTTLLQVLLTGLALLVLYGFLVKALGVAAMGVWSLISALTAIGRIGEAGLSMGLTRSVAIELASRNESMASSYIQTAIISLVLSVTAIVCIAFPLIQRVVMVSIDPDTRHLALELLPFSAASFVLLLVGSTLCGALDGTQRVDLRNIVMVVGSLSLVLSAFVLVPILGLKGLIISQICQACVVIVLSWILLRRQIAALPWFPTRWRRKNFIELFGFGLGIQVMQICSAAGDAVVKSAVSAYGGLAVVGTYELASKYVAQVRALLILPTQAMLPAVVAANSKSQEAVDAIYRKALKMTLYMSLPYHSLAIAITPALVLIWVADSVPHMQMYIVWLLLASAINSLCNPAYFSFVGIGRIRWLVIANIFIAITTTCGTILLGERLGANGVVVLSALSFAIGSLIILVIYHKERSIKLRGIARPFDLLVLVLYALGAAVSFSRFRDVALQAGAGIAFLFCALVVLIFIAIPVALHPMRRESIAYLRRAVGSSAAS